MAIAESTHTSEHGDKSKTTKLVGYLAEFAGPHELTEAAKEMHKAGYSKFDCYSPFPIHGIDDAMGTKRTILPFIVLACAFCGGITAFTMQWYTNGYDYKYIISGKPDVSIPSNMPVVFELSVLFSAFGAFLGMLTLNGLPKLYNAIFRVDAFRGVTQDKFFLGLDSDDPKFNFDHAHQFLGKLSPLSLTPYYDSGESRAIPAVFFQVLLFAGVLGLIPLAMLYNINTLTSDKPRYQIVQDMDFQPKLKTQKASNMFSDGRGMRPLIPGTIAQGMLNEDAEFYQGLLADKADSVALADLLPNAVDSAGVAINIEAYPWVKDFPVEVDAALMERGQQRYGIYCAPCHGQGGAGDGLVTERANQLMEEGKAAWVKPVSFHADTIRNQPIGKIFNTITHGIRKMPAYGAQIPVKDRWAIILYVRALQRSQNADKQDVPENMLNNMIERPKPEVSATTTTTAVQPVKSEPAVKIESKSKSNSEVKPEDKKQN